MAGFLVAGNWKMNGLTANLSEVSQVAKANPTPSCEIVICPPATLLNQMSERLASSCIRLGGQNCHYAASGAYTGEHSAEMLADAGASFVIVGHSERRQGHRENNSEVRAKVEAAWRANLIAIVCVGESEMDRLEQREFEVVETQFAESIPGGATSDNLVVAYEPVWAIGTGRTASEAEISDMHRFIRQKVTDKLAADNAESVRLLYGGSVNAANAAPIFSVPEVNGALVGGASLSADKFNSIVAAVPKI